MNSLSERTFVTLQWFGKVLSPLTLCPREPVGEEGVWRECMWAPRCVGEWARKRVGVHGRGVQGRGRGRGRRVGARGRGRVL